MHVSLGHVSWGCLHRSGSTTYLERVDEAYELLHDMTGDQLCNNTS